MSCIDRALRSAPRDAVLLIKRAECLLALGRPAEAVEAAASAQLAAPANPLLFDAIGSLFSRANEQQRALAAFDKAVSLAPGNPHFLFNRATVYRFLGRLADAESDYDRVIALRPGDYEAYVNRSELRTQSADANHVGELEALAARDIADWRGYVQIRYALAKEHEDLGQYERSFECLQQGARKRREHMRYDVATDVATVDWIIEAFPGVLPRAVPGGDDVPREPLRDAPGEAPGQVPGDARRDRAGGAPGQDVAQGDWRDDAPIFVVGLPRSGSTLVDRILSSHSAVESAGELNHFALCLVEAVSRRTGTAQLPRRELVARSAEIDFAALGHDYLARARETVPAGVRFIDKMPLNYLYCGLIRRALPQAKIVHVARHPMAVCYAMYKTLFKDGYPFSYDLQDIGRYYLAYRRLMDHWQATVPGIHTLSYEALVADQLGESRRLLAYCGLDWQDACAEFDRNSAPTTTASAVQVRRRIYQSSVSQWRHYAAQLAPLEQMLRAAGIEL
jgi:tetratricopeptide (TPR) repeat protein